ncbi:MAG: hypothetical protein J6Y85_03045 [Alphaproteobacteria bacterium]|nr:hypothetical protein [Alphaproteobacteria bacterium]
MEQQNRNEYEYGRSMLETLGVVALVGLLIIASLGGYSFVMKKWRARQTIDQISAIAVGMRAGNLAQRYQEGEIIPVSQIVRGIKTKEGSNNKVAALPDSPNSSAYVTSYGTNRYMLTLELDPDTLEEFLDQLNKQNNVVVTPSGSHSHNTLGDQHFFAQLFLSKSAVAATTITQNNNLYGADIIGIATGCSNAGCQKVSAPQLRQKKGKTKELVNDNGKVTVALFWGCRQGTYDYFWGGDCHEHEQGKCTKNEHCPDTEFGKHICDLSTNTCVMCTESLHCTKDTPNLVDDPSEIIDPSPRNLDWKATTCRGKKCTEKACETNTDCPDTEFARHICDLSTHTCVMCTESSHCTPQSNNLADKSKITDSPTPYEDDWKAKICDTSTKTCIECWKDNDCDTKFTRTIESGDEVKWEGVEIGTTYEWDGICTTETHVCAACRYSSNGTNERGYCPPELPICTNPNTKDADCLPCLRGKQWNNQKQKCVCPEGTLEYNNECVSCVDWKSTTQANEGCSNAGQPNDTCIVDSNEEPNTNKHGCHDCAVDYKAANGTTASACPKNSPVCSNYTRAEDNADYTCYRCQNTEADTEGQDGKVPNDAGCTDDEYPLCGQNNAGLIDKAFGTTCYRCINDKESDTEKDTGCPATAPLCDADEGQYGTSCSAKAVCYNTMPEAQVDKGCEADPAKPMCNNPVLNGAGTACMKCQNDQPDQEGTIGQVPKDTGCPEDQFPMCGASSQGFGLQCYKCINDNPDNAKDTGCPVDAPLCDADEGQYGTSCSAKAVCYNTKPEAQVDQGCEADSNKPMCNTTVDQGPGTACYKCQNNAQEEAGVVQATPDWGCTDPTKPLCNTKKVNGFANTCKKCQNNNQEEANSIVPIRDLGCTEEEYPLCAVATANSFADLCKACQNTNQEEDGVVQPIPDLGCTNSARPLCGNTAANGFSTACRKCQNTQQEQPGEIEAKQDLGCTDANSPMCGTTTDGGFANTCYKCINNQPDEEDANHKVPADTGCGTTLPMCKPASTSTSFGTGCYQCINDKESPMEKDTGCPEETPVCDAELGQYGNTCSARCDGCIDAQGVCIEDGCLDGNECINPNAYDDLYTDSNGMCQCYPAVRTVDVLADTIGCTVYDDDDKKQDSSDGDIQDERLTACYNCSNISRGDGKKCPTWHNSPVSGWEREREYQIPVNFYCPRYMHVSDSMTADDFVSSSYPAGIGVTSPAHPSQPDGKKLKKRHINTITPKVSDVNKTIVGDKTAILRIKDRWLAEVGMSTSGYFYFTTERDNENCSGTDCPIILSVSVGWSDNMTPEAKADAEARVCRHKKKICGKDGQADF